MSVQITHNNNGHFYRIAIDIAKEGAEVWDLTPYFKGRVGDDNFGLQIVWYYQGRLLDVTGKTPYIKGNVGHYSFDEKKNLQMAPDADVVTSHGKSSDCQANGQVTYYFPQQMFMTDGVFKGFIGLQDDNHNLTGVDIWFRVLPGVANMGKACDFYVDILDKTIADFKEKIRQQSIDFDAALQQELQKEKDLIQQKLDAASGAMDEDTAALEKLAVSVGAIQAQIDAGNVVTLEKHHEDFTELQEGQKELSVAIDNRLAKITYQPEELLNENAIKQKYPQGNDGKGAVIAADTGHKWLYVSGAWKDCGVYQAAGPDPEIVDLRTNTLGDKYKTAGEAIRSDFSAIAKHTQANSLDHRVMTNFDALGFTSAVKNGNTLFTGAPTFDDATPKIGSKFTGKTDGKTYWFTLAVAVRGYDVLQATFSYPYNPSAYSIFYLDEDNQVVRIEHFDKSDSSGNYEMSGQTKYTISNYPIYCDYNVSTVLIASIDSRPSASIRVPSTVADVPTKGHWINGSDLGNGSLNTTNMGFRVTTDLPICYDTEVTIFATNNVVFFIGYYDDPSGNSKATETFGERTWARIPAGQYFRLTLCHSDGSQTPLDVAEAVNSIHFRVPSRFDLANQREMLAQAELADRQENIYALVAQDAYDAGKHYHMEKIVDQDKEAKENLDGFQSVYLGKDALHMFGYHNGKPVDRTWNSAGELIAETEKPDTGHDGDVTKIGDDFYIIGSTIKDNTVVNNVIYKWDSKANAKEVIDISSQIGTATDASHVRFVAGIDRVEGSDSQLIIVTTDGLPDLGKGSIRSASDKLIFWKYDIPSDTLSEINEMRWTETFVQGVTCLDGITYIATNPITRHASDYAGIKIIGYDSGTFRKIKEIYIKGVFEAEGLSHVVENGVPKLVFGLCHYQDLMRVYSLTL